MNLKPTLLAAAVAVACGAMALAPTAFAAQNSTPDGTITFSGTVIANTCTVSVNGGGANQTVNLPTVFTSALGAAGDTTGQTEFRINVSGCDSNISTVSTFWSSVANAQADGNLKNTGTASGVEVQLLNSSKQAMALNAAQGAQNSDSVTPSGGSAELDYYAQYYATAGAGSGTVNTSVEYTMVYE